MSTGYNWALSKLSLDAATKINAIKAQAEALLNHTPRFPFFTLHGSNHLNNLFDIVELLDAGGIHLSPEEVFLMSAAICVHDLGMVISLSNADSLEIMEGRPESTDPAALEEFIRNVHHELIDAYYAQNFDFLLSLGVPPPQLDQIRQISRCHRKIVLAEQHGVVRKLGALLRLVDELDLGSNRAPYNVFMNLIDSMDTTSCWHWFKHNIVSPWVKGDTVHFRTENGLKRVEFLLSVHPNRETSVPYWLTQIRRPITKALLDDGAAEIIFESFGVKVTIRESLETSRPIVLRGRWGEVENKALSSGRKVILVIDDEFRKLEDLFIPLLDNYHLQQAYNARDAMNKMRAHRADLAIVDLQISSGKLYTPSETDDFKTTGIKICREIRLQFPQTKIGILTGTRHDLPPLDDLGLAFFLRKPVDPDLFIKTVANALE